MESIERLCVALNCRVDDILECISNENEEVNRQ